MAHLDEYGFGWHATHTAEMCDSMVRDHDLWFPHANDDEEGGGGHDDDPFGTELAPAAVSHQDEHADDILMMVESVDAEETLKLGVYAENFNELQQHLLSMQECSLKNYNFWDPPLTPPTTKPSFNHLPSIVSPDIHLDLDLTIASPTIDDAFQPPRQTPRNRQQHVSLTSYEKALLDNLAESMRRSQASRAEILRQRAAFGNHYSIRDMEQFEMSRRNVWSFIKAQQRMH